MLAVCCVIAVGARPGGGGYGGNGGSGGDAGYGGYGGSQASARFVQKLLLCTSVRSK